jgi:hypothetical protein
MASQVEATPSTPRVTSQFKFSPRKHRQGTGRGGSGGGGGEMTQTLYAQMNKIKIKKKKKKEKKTHPTFRPTSYVTLGRSPHLLGPQFPFL